MAVEPTTGHETHLRLFASLDADALRNSGLSGSAEGIKRTMIQSTAIPGTEYVTVLYIVEIDSGASVSHHTHLGIETLYILEGEANLVIEGEQDRHLKAGDTAEVLEGIVHSVTALVLEGEASLIIEGEPEKHLRPGDTAPIPIVKVRGMEAKAKPTKLLITYVIEKNSPLAASIIKKY